MCVPHANSRRGGVFFFFIYPMAASLQYNLGYLSGRNNNQPPPPPPPPVVVHYHHTNEYRRRCWCCPQLSPFFICSWANSINTSLWMTLFTLMHAFVALREWGRYYAGVDGASGMTTFLHGIQTYMFIQAGAEGTRPGAMLILVSIVSLSIRILTW